MVTAGLVTDGGTGVTAVYVGAIIMISNINGPIKLQETQILCRRTANYHRAININNLHLDFP